MKWGTFDVTKEKPSSLSNIGKEDSLFDWAYDTWKQGYLCCDDGAGEMADFISFIPGPPAIIWLIHAKGSGSAAANREVSVTDYEVVVAQALKNVRWLDRLNAAGKLADVVSKATSDLVWKDGTKIQRSVASTAFSAIGASAQREIHIVQPRLTKKRLDAARSGTATANQRRRVQRLDALLNAADIAARSVNATLSVHVDAG